PSTPTLSLHDALPILAPLIDEIGPGLAMSERDLAIEDVVPPDLVVEADRDQLYRVFLNLARNAVEAGAHRLRFAAAREAAMIARSEEHTSELQSPCNL